MSGSDRSGFLHDALFYANDEELLAAAVPFLQEGMAAGDLLLVNAPPRTTQLLTEALGPEAPIAFGALGERYASAARALSAYQEYVDHHLAAGVRGFRAVGEITPVSDPAAQRAWDEVESLYNRTFASYPVRGLCPFSLTALPAATIDAAELTHPFIISGTSRAPNPRYLEPADFVRRRSPLPPDPLEATPPAYAVVGPDLPTLRREIYLATVGTDLATESVDDFVSAVGEVVTNALTHGRPPVHVRVWVRQHRLLCTVTDRGPGLTDPFAGFERPVLDDPTVPAVGLWVARQLCESLACSVTDAGFTVRLRTEA